jgi:hypothetical protein
MERPGVEPGRRGVKILPGEPRIRLTIDSRVSHGTRVSPGLGAHRSPRLQVRATGILPRDQLGAIEK